MMRFIVDAQLPYSLKKWLLSQGYDAIHTKELLRKNLTEDTEIIKIAIKEERVIISKDSDFLKYFILHQPDYKLLLITTGNIVNSELIRLIEQNFENLLLLMKKNNVVEMNNHLITVHSSSY